MRKVSPFIFALAAATSMILGSVPVHAKASEFNYIRDGVNTPVYEVVEETEAETNPPEPEYVYEFSSYEEDLLLRMGMAEAGDQGVYGIALVMRVCLNRVANPSWPSTIEGVITQPGQYSTWPGPIQSCTPSAECYEALEWIKNGWDESYGAEYFCMYYLDFSSWAQYLYTYGDHHFYR